MSTTVAPFAAQSSTGPRLVTPTGDHAVVMANTQRTNGSLTVIELVNKPKNGPPLHRHVHDDEVWYVLEGEYRFQAGDATFRVSEGGMAFGPRGVPHAFQNVGDAAARLLVITTPAGAEQYFEDFAKLPPGPIDPEASRPSRSPAGSSCGRRSGLDPLEAGRLESDRALRRPRSRRPGGACLAGAVGPAGRHLQGQTLGRRWRRSRASAISWAPADGDMPNASANGSGVNAATAGVPSPPSDSSARRAAPPNVSTPVSEWRGGGRPSGRRAGACGTRRVVRLVRLSAAASSTPTGSRSPTSYSSRTVVLMGLSQASTTDTRRPQNPLSTRGFVDRDLLVIWRTVEHPRSVRNPTDRTTRDRAGWSYSTGGGVEWGAGLVGGRGRRPPRRSGDC